MGRGNIKRLLEDTGWEDALRLFENSAGVRLAVAVAPSDQGYAPNCLLIDPTNGLKYNSGTATTATWTAIGASGVTLQTAFAAGGTITGAAAATKMTVGDGTDALTFYAVNASNMAYIGVSGGCDITIIPNAALTVTGTLTVSGTVTSTGNFTVGANKLVVTAASGNVSTAGLLTFTASTGNAITVNTNMFLVAADTGNVTSAGDVACATLTCSGNITGTFAGTWSSSTWNANPTINVTATTGKGLTIEGATVTTGSVLYLHGDASLTSGYFLRCENDASDVFTVGATGATIIAGAAATTVFTITAGDVALSSGRMAISGAAVATDLLTLTRSNSATGGNAVDIHMGSAAQAGDGVNISWSGAGTGDGVAVNMTNNVAGSAANFTGAGVRTDHLVKITDVPAATACTMYLGVTPTAADAAAYAFQIQTAGTGIAPCVYIAHTNAYATAANGVIHLAMANAVASTGLAIVSSGSRVRPLISLTDTSGDGGGGIKIAATNTHANAFGVQITETGTAANNLVELRYNGANTGDAVNILMTNSAAGAQGIVFVSAVAHTSPNVSLTSANGAAATLYMSNGSTDAAGHGISILQHGAGANNAIDIAYDAASTGDALAIVMTNAGATANAVSITGVSNTVPLISVTSVGGDEGVALWINSTATHADGYVVEIVENGAVANPMISLAAAGNNYIGDAINISLAAANVAAQAIVLTGKAAFTSPLVSLTTAGGAAGDAIYIASTSGNATGRVINILEQGSSTNEIINIALLTGAFAGDAVAINMTNAGVGGQALVITAASAHTSPTVQITAAANADGGDVFKITNTAGHANANSINLVNAGVVAHNAIKITYTAASIGDAVNINLANSGVGAQGLVISSSVNHTSPTISVTTVGGAAGDALYFASTSTNAAGHVINILESGTVANSCLNIAYNGANIGDAITITMNNAGAASQAFVVSSNVAHTGNLLSVTQSAGLAGGTGKVAFLTNTGTIASATTGFLLDVYDNAGGATATSYAVCIRSTLNEALAVTVGKSKFVEAITCKASNVEYLVANKVSAGGVDGTFTGVLTDCEGANVTLAAGLLIYLELGALAFTAGAATFNLNAGGAVNVKSNRNTAANIGTGYTAGASGAVPLYYNGAVWVDLSQ